MPSPMRTPHPRARPPRLVATVGTVIVSAFIAACGGAPPPSEAAAATATPPTSFQFATPWPHFAALATADDVYLALLADRIDMVPVNATSGGPGHEPVKRINANYGGWPIAISQYTSAKSLKAAARWTAGGKPGKNEAPVEFIGQNMLILWGPVSDGAPPTPNERQTAIAVKLRAALDRLISPIQERTIVKLPTPLPSGDAGASQGPSTPVPSTP